MHHYDGGDAVVRVEKAERGAAGIEQLRDDDAADNGGMNFGGDVGREKAAPGCVAPAPIECESEQQNIGPVDQQRYPIVNELGQKRSGKGNQTDRAQERDVNPGEVAVRRAQSG